MDIFLNKMIQFYLNNTINIRLFNSNQYVVLYPQNGDRIVTTDSDVISPYMYVWQLTAASQRTMIS